MTTTPDPTVDVEPPVELLTVAETAKRLRVGEVTVRRWIREGKLPASTTLGGHFRIPSNVVDDIATPTREGAPRHRGAEAVGS